MLWSNNVPFDTKPNAMKNRKKKLEKIQSKGWYWIESMQETFYDSTTDKHQVYFEVRIFLYKLVVEHVLAI